MPVAYQVRSSWSSACRSGGQPVVLDPQRAALLGLWNHCVHCETCTTRDEDGINANLPCAAAERLYGVYRRAAGARGVRS